MRFGSNLGGGGGTPLTGAKLGVWFTEEVWGAVTICSICLTKLKSAAAAERWMLDNSSSCVKSHVMWHRDCNSSVEWVLCCAET